MLLNKIICYFYNTPDTTYRHKIEKGRFPRPLSVEKLFIAESGFPSP
jgi:hypothetical protein